MEQKDGKYCIKASTILDITLQDYHQSRKQYGSDLKKDSENTLNMSRNQINNNYNNNNINLNAAEIFEVKFFCNLKI